MEYRLVKVLWQDATGGEKNGWRDLDQIADMDPCEAVSVGYLVYDGLNHIIVCPHLVHTNSDNPQGDGEIGIPRDWINQIIDLEDGTPHITLE